MRILFEIFKKDFHRKISGYFDKKNSKGNFNKKKKQKGRFGLKIIKNKWVSIEKFSCIYKEDLYSSLRRDKDFTDMICTHMGASFIKTIKKW